MNNRSRSDKNKFVDLSINIKPSALAHFKCLLKKENKPDLHLRMMVLNQNSDNAEVDIMYCPKASKEKDDMIIEYPDFDLYVEASSVFYLNPIEIDYVANEFGGYLSIQAPNLKKKSIQLSENSTLFEKIQYFIETEINPALNRHGGQLQAVDFKPEEGTLMVEFKGGCQGCGMIKMTFHEGVEKSLKRSFPEIQSIVDMTEHEKGKNPFVRC